MQRILRWSVPVDNAPHEIGGGPVVEVAWRPSADESVEVWTLELCPSDGQNLLESRIPKRLVQVVATAQGFPRGWIPVGSTLQGHTSLWVWHVCVVPA